MARKGVLVSDPTVSRMTPAQWLFEYHGLLRREEEETERAFKGMKGILINVLGLNLKSSNKNKDLPPHERFEADLNEFTPLVMLAGNHHLLKQFFSDGDDTIGQDRTGESKVSDAEYEAQSQAIMSDMEPIDVPIARMSVDDIQRQVDTQGLGIQNVDETPFPLPSNTVIIRDGEE
jgi:hypothetical protein